MVNSVIQRLLDGLFPQHCVLCDLPSENRLPLCDGCAGDLYPNDIACPRCALPLPPSIAGTSLGPGRPGQDIGPPGRRGETTAAYPAPYPAALPPRLTSPDPPSCGACQNQPPPFARAVAPWLYEEQLAHVIGRWKYGRETWLTPLLGDLWRRAAPALEPPDLLVPVPLHWRRRWRRGFNQSELLCGQVFKALGRQRHCAVDSRLVRRRRHTPPQSALQAGARRGNLRGAFTVHRPCDNLRIAIVDDVLTTGATAAALATALYAAGAARVEVWCLARTPAPPT